MKYYIISHQDAHARRVGKISFNQQICEVTLENAYDTPFNMYHQEKGRSNFYNPAENFAKKFPGFRHEFKTTKGNFNDPELKKQNLFRTDHCTLKMEKVSVDQFREATRCQYNKRRRN